jgi:hypothetical protein
MTFSKSFLSLFVSLASLIVFAGLARADGHFGMAWNYSQYNDEMNRGRMTSSIVIGVPETDNIIGTAGCFAGSTAGLPTLELGADVGNQFAGDTIDIEFFADAGPMLYRGEVKAAQSEEDYTGVRLQLDMNDPLWQVMRRMGSISYRVNGRSIELPLRGSSRSIAFFLEDCRAYHGNFNPNGNQNLNNTAGGNNGGQVPTVPANQPFDPRWATCDTMANVVSQNSDTPVTVTFRNQSDGFRSVMWIGFDGTPKEYAALNAGEEFTINTFLTHPWMFTDGPGNCLEMFMPQLGVSVFNITAPNRDFGPE